MSTQLLITILGGVAVAVLIWLGRQVIRMIRALYETVNSVKELGDKFDAFTPLVDGRLMRVERMVQRVWQHLFPGEEPPA